MMSRNYGAGSRDLIAAGRLVLKELPKLSFQTIANHGQR